MGGQKFSLITTCRGRLHHLRETLPLMVAQSDAQVILVDDACPDGAGSWAEANFPDVTVVRQNSQDGFNLARARNAGVRAASGEWLLFVDADVRMHTGLADWARASLQTGHFYWIEADPVGRRDRDLFGTLICHHQDFAVLEGYDEAFQGWGGEDSDLRERLIELGLKEDFFPARFLSAISHSDAERAGWAGVSDRAQKHVLIQCYKFAKTQFSRAQGKGPQLSLAARQGLWNFTAKTIVEWCGGDMKQPLQIKYRLLSGEGRPVSRPYSMHADLNLELRITREDFQKLAETGMAGKGVPA